MNLRFFSRCGKDITEEVNKAKCEAFDYIYETFYKESDIGKVLHELSITMIQFETTFEKLKNS